MQNIFDRLNGVGDLWARLRTSHPADLRAAFRYVRLTGALLSSSLDRRPHGLDATLDIHHGCRDDIDVDVIVFGALGSWIVCHRSTSSPS